jgi:hypothetical protein
VTESEWTTRRLEAEMWLREREEEDVRRAKRGWDRGRRGMARSSEEQWRGNESAWRRAGGARCGARRAVLMRSWHSFKKFDEGKAVYAGEMDKDAIKKWIGINQVCGRPAPLGAPPP